MFRRCAVAVFTVVLILNTVFCCPCFAEISGDVNGDNKITVADLAQMRMALFGVITLDSEQFACAAGLCAPVDKLTAEDLFVLKDIMLKNKTAPV